MSVTENVQAGTKEPAAPRPESAAVAALRKGLSVLDVFSTGDEFGVNELARKVGVHKSTVSRLCATLESCGYLQRDEASGRFKLGTRVAQGGGARATGGDLREDRRPVPR